MLFHCKQLHSNCVPNDFPCFPRDVSGGLHQNPIFSAICRWYQDKVARGKIKRNRCLGLSKINKLEAMWLMIRLMRENRHYFGKVSTSATTNSRRSYSAAYRASEERRFFFLTLLALVSDTTRHLFINFHFDALFIADSSSCDSFNQKFLLFWTRIEYFIFR